MMEEQLLGAIIGILVSLGAGFTFWVRFKRRFSQVVDLLMTLDSAWKDDRVTEAEWNAIWDKLMRLISSAPRKDIGE